MQVRGWIETIPTCHNRPELTAHLHPSGELIPPHVAAVQIVVNWRPGHACSGAGRLAVPGVGGCRARTSCGLQITTDSSLVAELTELAGVVECWCERCDKEQAGRSVCFCASA